MFRVLFSLVLAGLLIHVSPAAVRAQGEAHALKTKARITNLSKPGKGIVEIKLRDGRKLLGQISDLKDDQFTLIELNTKTAIPIAYTAVKQAQTLEQKSGRSKVFMAFAFAGLGLALVGLAATLIHPE
jgi:hypothetical protein